MTDTPKVPARISLLPCEAPALRTSSELADLSRLAQYIVGFLTGLFFLIAVFYGLTDIDSLFETTYVFPLGEIYRQVTGTSAGAIGLLFLVLAPTSVACMGCYLTASRVRVPQTWAPFCNRFREF